jgi:Domain of unknown function (DUF1996)
MSFVRRLVFTLVRGALFVVLPLAVVGAAVGLARLSHRGDRGSFVVGCAWSHSLPADPIVFPGRPSASHLHDFYGNTATKAGSTRRSLLRASTTCRDADDLAAVWSPAAFLSDARIIPVRERTYYIGRAGSDVHTVPPDLKVLAGNPSAASVAEASHVSWYCGGDSPIASHPYDCEPYRETSADGLVARIDFPGCWDGVNTDSPDHRSHLAYGSRRSCPASHPVSIPRIRVRVHYGIWDPCAGARPCAPEDTPEDNLAFRLSSGPYYTIHADFWNTWRQAALDHLVATCINAAQACRGDRA